MCSDLKPCFPVKTHEQAAHTVYVQQHAVEEEEEAAAY